jgi:hypothetical protein
MFPGCSGTLTRKPVSKNDIYFEDVCSVCRGKKLTVIETGYFTYQPVGKQLRD